MYIHPSLFGSRGPRNSPPAILHNHDNVVMHDIHQAAIGKRKRQGDAEDGRNNGDDGPQAFQQHALGWHKSVRKQQWTSHGPIDPTTYGFRTPSKHTPPIQRPLKQLKRMSPKPALQKIPSHLMDLGFGAHLCPSTTNNHDIISTPFPVPPVTVSTSDLRACHICHSAPKRKKEMENYLECRSCLERACFICARECSGGCQKQLCSKCCVEVGQEGDTYCLDCYQRIVNST